MSGENVVGMFVMWCCVIFVIIGGRVGRFLYGNVSESQWF